jgi:propanol-preferring alcohol dehydrogenase
MKAMVLNELDCALQLSEIETPRPTANQVQIEIEACGVCRTDLHIVDHDLKAPKLPLIPGHEIVGRVSAVGSKVIGLKAGQRVGVPWLGHTCGTCPYCRRHEENLCDEPGFTGYTIDGGFAEACVANADYVFPLPAEADPVALAPLLCAGLIGYRSLAMAGDAKRLGIYGFGAAAHILAQIAVWQHRDVYALTRPGDRVAQDFARHLGVAWAGGSDECPPSELDAALIFAPVGSLVPIALKAVRKGGRVICGGIHMSDIPSFPYSDLWGERQIKSVANLTRRDGEDFLHLAQKAGVKAEVAPYKLEEANRALSDLRNGKLQGAAVLVP